MFAAGHHPLRSNGAHGSAGSYESIEVGTNEIPIPVPIMDGETVLDFTNQTICGTVDIAFAGHDHNNQWIDEPSACGGAELIVSGAGASVKAFDNPERNATLSERRDRGFLLLFRDRAVTNR